MSLTNQTLPRINSQKKIIRHPSQTAQRRTEQGTSSISSLRRPKSHSDLHSARKALQSANSSKAVCLQATTVVYLKKIQTLEKQQFLLDRQIKQVKGDIQELRVKRKSKEEPMSTTSSRCSTFLTKEGPKMKIEGLRKKIDKENQKMKRLMGDIDKTRKEIQTTKKLNQNLEKQVDQWVKKSKNEQNLMNQLQQKVSQKMNQVQQKKIEDIHQKTHLIKDYDALLRKLDHQLGKPSTSQSQIPSQFYLTDVASQPVSSNKALPQQSPKGKKVSSQVNYLKQKAEQWQQNVEQIKEKAKAKDLNQVEQNLMQKHNKYFHQYKYLNERYDYLDQLRQRQNQIKSRRQQILQKYVEVPPTRQTQEICQLEKQILQNKSKSEKYKKEIQHLDEMFSNLKDFSINFGAKSGHHLDIEGEPTWQTLASWLEQILKVKNRLKIKGSS